MMILNARAGRQLCLDGLVQQRIIGIGDQLVPLAIGNSHGEIVGIESRAADHGQDFAGARVHGDHGSVSSSNSLFRRDLQIDVEGQLELLPGTAGFWSSSPISFPLLFTRTWREPFFPIKTWLVLQLDPGSAHHVARVIELPACGWFSICLAHLADVADRGAP